MAKKKTISKPSKLHAFTAMMEKIYTEYGVNTIVLTRNELWRLTNSRLPKKDKVGLSTFSAWCSPTSARNLESIQGVSDDDKEMFIDALEMFKIRSKLALGESALNYKDQKNSTAAFQMLKSKFKDFREEKQNISLGIGASGGGFTISLTGASPDTLAALAPKEEEIIEIDHKEID